MLASGIYHMTLGLSSYERSFHYIENVASFVISEVSDNSLDKTIVRKSGAGVFLNPMNVRINEISDNLTTSR